MLRWFRLRRLSLWRLHLKFFLKTSTSLLKSPGNRVRWVKCLVFWLRSSPVREMEFVDQNFVVAVFSIMSREEGVVSRPRRGLGIVLVRCVYDSLRRDDSYWHGKVIPIRRSSFKLGFNSFRPSFDQFVPGLQDSFHHYIHFLRVPVPYFSVPLTSPFFSLESLQDVCL